MAGKKQDAVSPGSLSAHATPDKPDRIAHIERIMASNAWVTGVTGRRLADEWGITYDTVKKDAAEASRNFRADPSERDALKARLHAKVEAAQELASSGFRLEALASLLKLEGDLLGAFEPQKIDLNVSGDDNELARRIAAKLSGDEAGEDSGQSQPPGTSTH